MKEKKEGKINNWLMKTLLSLLLLAACLFVMLLIINIVRSGYRILQ